MGAAAYVVRMSHDTSALERKAAPRRGALLVAARTRAAGLTDISAFTSSSPCTVQDVK